MAEKKFENATAGEKLSGYVMRHRTPIIIITAVIVAAIIVYGVYATVTSKINDKGISQIDTIEYTLTKDSSTLSDTDIETRRAAAMTSIAPYLKKSGIVGVRANMLAAEIAYERKDYENAKDYWKKAASKGSKSYTAPLAYYNEAVCCEETGDLANAVKLYGKAADSEEFMLTAHARFSEGRVYEALGDYKNATVAYNKLNDASPDDTWAHLAKTRLITLKADGKIE